MNEQDKQRVLEYTREMRRRFLASMWNRKMGAQRKLELEAERLKKEGKRESCTL